MTTISAGRVLALASIVLTVLSAEGHPARATGAPGAVGVDQGRDVELLGAALQVGGVLAAIRIASECPWFPSEKKGLLVERLERGKQEFLGTLLGYGYARHEIDRARELIDGSAAEMMLRLAGGRLVLCNRRDFRRTVTDSVAELDGAPEERLTALTKRLPDLGIAVPDAKALAFMPPPAPAPPTPAPPARKPAADGPQARPLREASVRASRPVPATADAEDAAPPAPPRPFDSVDFDRILLMEGLHARCGVLRSDESGRVQKVLHAAAPRFAVKRRSVADFLALRRAYSLRAVKHVRCGTREQSQIVREGRASMQRFR